MEFNLFYAGSFEKADNGLGVRSVNTKAPLLSMAPIAWNGTHTGASNR
jgi:hypothetical protein